MSELAKRVAQYRAIHKCSIFEAKRAIAKEDLLKAIEDLEYYEAYRPLKDILKTLTEVAFSGGD